MLILASLSRRYRLSSAPGPDPEPTSRLTIRSLDGISLCVWKRPEDLQAAESYEPQPDQEEEFTGDSAKCPFH